MYTFLIVLTLYDPENIPCAAEGGWVGGPSWPFVNGIFCADLGDAFFFFHLHILYLLEAPRVRLRGVVGHVAVDPVGREHFTHDFFHDDVHLKKT